MAHAQSQGFVGQPMARREDARLLIGEGQFVADMVLPGMGHVAFVRSPHAHARIRGVDLTRARALPGVWLALSGAELQQALPAVGDQQLVLPRKWRSKVKHEIIDPRQPLLAFDKVRHVGEAVAVIVAASRYIAEDAAELVELDLEALPPVVDPLAALEPGASILHERYGTNLLAEFSIAKGDVALALSNSQHRLLRRFYHHRYAAVPMECRGVIAQYDKRTCAYTIWSSTQMVHWVRREVATTLAVPEASVRCIAPDVGGGFGGKGHVAGGVVRNADADRVPGAALHHEFVTHRQQPTVAVETDFDIVQLVARVAGAVHVLAPVLDPLYRRAQLLCQERQQHVFRVHVPLAAEAAADIRRDAAYARLGHRQRGRHLAPHPVHHLRG